MNEASDIRQKPPGLVRLKNKLHGIYNICKSSWKIKSSLFFILSLLIINVILMYYGQFSVRPESVKEIVGNSFYLTTTQLSTIGYGDITPVSQIARIVTSIAHLAVIFITFSIVEEFGAISVAKKLSEERHIIYANNDLMKELLKGKEIKSVADATEAIKHIRTVGVAQKKFKNLINHDRRSTSLGDSDRVKERSHSAPSVYYSNRIAVQNSQSQSSQD